MALYQMPDGNNYEFTSDKEATVAMEQWNKQFGSGEDKSKIASFFGGVAKPTMGYLQSTGMIEEDTYKRFLENYRPYEEANPTTAMIGNVGGVIAPVVGGTLSAATMSGPAAPIVAPTTAALLMDALTTGQRYAELQHTPGMPAVDKETAGLAAGEEGTMNALGVLSPASTAGNVAKRFISGGAINTLQGGITRGTTNQILEDYPEHQVAVDDPKSLAMEFGLGGVMGAALGPKSIDSVPTIKRQGESAPTNGDVLPPNYAKEQEAKADQLDRVDLQRKKEILIKLEDAILDINDPVKKAEATLLKEQYKAEIDVLEKRISKTSEHIDEANAALDDARLGIKKKLTRDELLNDYAKEQGITRAELDKQISFDKEAKAIADEAFPETIELRPVEDGWTNPNFNPNAEPYVETRGGGDDAPRFSKKEQALFDTVRPIEEAITTRLGLEDLNFTENQLAMGIDKTYADLFNSLAQGYGLKQGRDGDIPLIKSDDSGYIDVLHLPKDMRGDGLGTKIADQIEADLLASGRRSSYLMSEPDAIGFWEKRGYVKSDVESTDGNVMMTKQLAGDDAPTVLPGARIDPDVDVSKLVRHIRDKYGLNKIGENTHIDKRLSDFAIDKGFMSFVNKLGLGKDSIYVVADSTITTGRLTVKNNSFIIRINPTGISKEFDSVVTDGTVRQLYDNLSSNDQYRLRRTITLAHELGHVFFYKTAHHYWRNPKEIADLIGKYTAYLKKNPKWIAASQYLFPEQFMGRAKYRTGFGTEERILSFKEYFANQVAKELIYDNVKMVKRGEVSTKFEQGSRLAEFGREVDNSFAESQLTRTQEAIKTLETRLKEQEQLERVRAVQNELISANTKDVGEMPDYTRADFGELSSRQLRDNIRQLKLTEDRWLKELSKDKHTKVESEYMGLSKELDTTFYRFTSDIRMLAKGMVDFLKEVFNSITRDIDLRATTSLGGDIIRNIIKRNDELSTLGETVWQDLDRKHPSTKKTTYEQDVAFASHLKNYSTEYSWNRATKPVPLSKNNPFDDAPPITVKQAVANAGSNNDLPGVGSWFVRNFIGRRNNSGIWFDSPLVQASNKVMNDATQRATQIFYKLMHGDADLSTSGPLRTLHAAMTENSVANILKRSKAEDIANVFDILKRNYDIQAVEPKELTDMKAIGGQGFDPSRALEIIKNEYKKINTDNLSPEQKKIFESLTTMWAKQHIEEVKIFIGMRKKNIPPFHPGWYPAVRSGDFYFTLSLNGRTIHAQYFRTKELAQKVVDRFNSLADKQGIKISTVEQIADKGELEQAHELVRLYGENSDQLKKVDDFIQRLKIYGGKLGKHHEYRYNVDGYMGTELFNSREEMGNAFRRAIEESVNERTSIVRKALVTHGLAPILEDSKLKDTHPNTIKNIELMHDMVQNKVPNLLEPMDKAIDAKFEAMYLWARKPIAKQIQKFGKVIGNKTLSKIDPDELPQVSTFKKAHGTAGNLFYVWALMSRPAFWVGQALTPITTVPRTLLRETSLVDSMSSMGQGLQLIMFGDKEFNRIAKYVRDTTDTFHPQFINDFNNLGFLDKSIGEQGRKTLDWFTGQAESTMIDAWSRYYSFAVSYAHNKKMGLSGEELIDKSIDMTGEAAVLYGRAEKAPVFQRIGTTGEMISPLQTFAQAQLGNMIADFRRMTRTHNAKPFLATYLLTMLMGGTMGTALVAEYEFFRRLFGLEEYLPSVIEWSIKGDNFADRVVSHGAVSASTLAVSDEGFDIGSSLRYNPILAGILIGDRTFLQTMPAVSFAWETTKQVGTALESHIKDIPEAERRQAALALTPGGYRAIVDATKYDSTTRDFVPDKEGNAKIAQSGEKVVAQALGTKTLTESVESTRTFLDKIKDQTTKTKVRRSLNLAMDGLEKDNVKLYNSAIDQLVSLGYTGDEIYNSLVNKAKMRNIPEYQRSKYGLSGSVTASKARNIQQFEELE